MMTQDRYEVVKKWGNYIFLFHKMEVNPTSRERFKKLLIKLTETGEFEWQTNPETKSVEIRFGLGQIDVRVENTYYVVSMNQATKQALQSFKEQNHQAEKSVENKSFEVAQSTAEPMVENKVEIPSEQNRDNVISMPLKEQKTQIEKEEQQSGESIFLDFLTVKEGWM